MKLKTLIFGPLMFCLLWFLGWEAYGIWDARQKTEAIFAEFRNENGLRLLWRDLTPEQQDILIKVEDPKFMTHKGVDLETPGAGLTGITQAIADHLYFGEVTPGFTKLELSLIAFFVIDPQVSKEDQLNTFLNIADFGEVNGLALIGFDEASRVFFAKPPRTLTRSEFIQLVGSLLDPVQFRPGGAANAQRSAKIEAYLKGECQPQSRRDVFYEAC